MEKYADTTNITNFYLIFKLNNENGEKGFNWCDDIHMSFQSKDATGTLKEIINMVKVNKLTAS